MPAPTTPKAGSGAGATGHAGTVDQDDRRWAAATHAAQEVGEDAGWRSTDPVALQRSNNVVLWLQPHPIVAKVGTWPRSVDSLGREVATCEHLAAAGAPVGVPAAPRVTVHEGTGFPVSLWHRLDVVEGAVPDPAARAEALQAIHRALRDIDLELPSFFDGFDHARLTLFDDAAMRALAPVDLTLVRSRFDQLEAELRARPLVEQPIHGEPHLANVLLTPDGPHYIDFEGVSLGPVEWDLASVDLDVADCFPDVDRDLLALTRALNSARVATWCFANDRFPEMRSHGEVHLELLRSWHR